jgi:hypothetical protein
MFKTSFCAIVGILGIWDLYSQSTSAVGIFPTIDHTGKLTDKLEYGIYYFGALPLAEISEKRISTNAYTLLIYSEQGLTYRLGSNLTINGSYVYQKERASNHHYLTENRIHLQATYQRANSKLGLRHRIRFDNRFVKNPMTDKTPYTHRLRYLIGFQTPINAAKNNLYITGYQEMFLNTFKNTASIYAENWAYAGIGKNLNPNHKLEAGLLYITWRNASSGWFNQYYGQLSWILNADFRKSNQAVN